MEKYPFSAIESKWQKFWQDNETFRVTEDPRFPESKRLYVLDMFPYPSGAGLHVGHPEGYTATDIYCRFKKLNGFNVLHPMGFDAFGLPAENYAIQTGTHPAVTTENNIANFTRQIKSLGFSYDWSREVRTCDESYYKWTQYIFKKLFDAGLAYEAEMPINWCPKCKTGLANEEVKEGKCERCGTEVTRKPLKQWMLKITAYAEKLLSGLDTLDWPESVKAMQRNWIGRSEGTEVDFVTEGGDKLTVFTTRVDTLFGATFMVLSPEHPLVKKLTTSQQKSEVERYTDAAAKKSDLERTDLNKTKTGVFTGSYAINPINGEKLPIWVADYVLMGYGTGAIMAVPAHDERDWEFAKKFGLKIIAVLEGGGDCQDKAYTEDGKHINSCFLNGMGKQKAIEEARNFLVKKGAGRKTINYKLRDWVFSRQRFWGEPMPLVHCPKCGIVAIDEKDLPLVLPECKKFEPSGDGSSPLSKIDSFMDCTCPKCGGKAKRESNTMPQWAGSCWYYLRYLDPHNPSEFCSKEKEKYWMPVDLYVGGAEHAVLHLLYARFWHHVLYDLGLVSTSEPFQKLVNQGLITAFSYKRANGSLVPTDQVKEDGGKFYASDTGEELTEVIAKMSKSLKNVINPDDVIAQYGADSLRMYEMFLGPLEVSKPWATNGISGVWRFLDKFYHSVACGKITDSKPSGEVAKLYHKTIKKVTGDIDSLQFNTAISQMMILLNEVSKLGEVPREIAEGFTIILSPFAPHLAEEAWEKLGHKGGLNATAEWPKWDESLTKDTSVTVGVQVNGKVRSVVEVPVGASSDELLAAAKADEKVQAWITGKTIVKEIAIPGRIVNIVVK